MTMRGQQGCRCTVWSIMTTLTMTRILTMMLGQHANDEANGESGAHGESKNPLSNLDHPKIQKCKIENFEIFKNHNLLFTRAQNIVPSRVLFAILSYCAVHHFYYDVCSSFKHEVIIYQVRTIFTFLIKILIQHNQDYINLSGCI